MFLLMSLHCHPNPFAHGVGSLRAELPIGALKGNYCPTPPKQGQYHFETTAGVVVRKQTGRPICSPNLTNSCPEPIRTTNPPEEFAARAPTEAPMLSSPLKKSEACRFRQKGRMAPRIAKRSFLMGQPTGG